MSESCSAITVIGLITPLVGLNGFLINSMSRDVPMIETFKGVVPYLMSDAVRVTLIVAFPALSLFPPHLIGG